MNAIFAGLITAGSDDPPFVRCAADDQRFALKFRKITLLD
jgi:hypothetical protein